VPVIDGVELTGRCQLYTWIRPVCTIPRVSQSFDLLFNVCICVADDPRKLLADGKLANVPILFGTNRDEGTMFTQWYDDVCLTT
jgi:hypothetical protein